jgi:hypothetical protein
MVAFCCSPDREMKEDEVEEWFLVVPFQCLAGVHEVGLPLHNVAVCTCRCTPQDKHGFWRKNGASTRRDPRATFRYEVQAGGVAEGQRKVPTVFVRLSSEDPATRWPGITSV